MLKKMLALALGTLVSSGAMAEDDHTALRVSLNDGQVVTIWLGDMPVISNVYVKESGSYVMTVTSSDATFTFPVEEVKKADFISTPTSVEELEANDGESFAFTDGRCVHLRGIKGKVSVYSLDGKAVNADVKYAGESSVDVDLSGLHVGTYLVCVANGRTYKVMKR